MSDMGEQPLLIVDTCVKIDAAFERRPDSFLLVRSVVGLAAIGSVMLLETDGMREETDGVIRVLEKRTPIRHRALLERAAQYSTPVSLRPATRKWGVSLTVGDREHLDLFDQMAADVLVTRDKKLLGMNRRIAPLVCTGRILTPDQCLEFLHVLNILDGLDNL